MLITLTNQWKAKDASILDVYQNKKFNYGNLVEDTFVKNSNAISFKGGNNKVKESNIGDAMQSTKIAGGSFLTGLALSIAMVKLGPNAKELLAPKEGFTLEDNGNIAKSSDIILNGYSGECKIPKVGIDLDDSRFDYSNAAKGIYTNHDKGINIDLLHNKYIDPENGIFVDPEAQISSIKFGDHVEHIGIPSFGIHYQINREPEYLKPVTRQEFIEKYDMTPEEFNKTHGSVLEIIPNDNRTMLQKIRDYFVIDPKNYDTSKDYDIFGREILKVSGNHGDIHLISIPDANDDVFKAFRDAGENIQHAAELTNQHLFADYIRNNPNLSGGLQHLNGDTITHAVASDHPVNHNLGHGNNVTDHITTLDHPVDTDLGDHHGIIDTIANFFNHLL